jgi:putative methionine-R-sulfoxide reductase with GAF domain
MTFAGKLSDLKRCFQGVVPSIITTSDGQGVPNVTFISHVYYVDEQHVALSCQFFNKTRKNLDENPLACVEVWEPVTLQAYRLHLRFLRSEKSGPLFDTMATRIDAIASHTGMSGVFRLIAADLFEVKSIEVVDGFLVELPPEVTSEPASLEGLRTEVRGLQCVSDRINRAPDLETLLHNVLEALDDYFHFSHTSVLLFEEASQRLVTLASRGYGESGVGAEVVAGHGVIGTVARDRRVVRLTNLEADLQYARAIRREAEQRGGTALQMEVPLPGLPDAQSVLAIPLAIGDRLIGVLSAEDRDPMRFGEWHEAYLEIVGNQIALGIDRMLNRAEEQDEAPQATLVPAVQAPPRRNRRRTLTFYKSDDAIFVDDEYLIRNVPARILWKVLRESQRTGRTEFSNRELRLDAWLGLPPVKANLESRLILLRQRLREKCPDIQITPAGRGRFSLHTGPDIELTER